MNKAEAEKIILSKMRGEHYYTMMDLKEILEWLENSIVIPRSTAKLIDNAADHGYELVVSGSQMYEASFENIKRDNVFKSMDLASAIEGAANLAEIETGLVFTRPICRKCYGKGCKKCHATGFADAGAGDFGLDSQGKDL